jgi:predicted O-methyltransferase YrrM
VNPVLAEILSTQRVRTRDGSSVPLDHQISRHEGETLQQLIRERRPRVTLEVGFAYGISTLFICEAMAETGGERHIVIDPLQDEGWRGIGRFTVERAGYAPLLEVHVESSHQALPMLERQGRRIDLAFIDGWHTFDYVMIDFFYVDRLLNVGGVVMLDDMGYPAVRKLARYILTHRRYERIDAGSPPPRSLKRRALGAVMAGLRVPLFRSIAKHALRPDVLVTDRMLGLDSSSFVTLLKKGEDVLGDGTHDSRKWDQHADF